MKLSTILDQIRSRKDQNPFLTTGIPGMDWLLTEDASRARKRGASAVGTGVKRGTAVEICGPPGSGKTFTGIMLAKDALLRGHQVIWITACNKVVPIRRLADLLKESPSPALSEEQVERTLRSFFITNCRALGHLHILLKRMIREAGIDRENNPAEEGPDISRLALVVIDDISFLVEGSYNHSVRNDDLQDRRRRAINELCICMEVLAQRSNSAVVALSYMISRGIGSGISKLVPCLGYGQFEVRLARRIVLYREDKGHRMAMRMSTSDVRHVGYDPDKHSGVARTPRSSVDSAFIRRKKEITEAEGSHGEVLQHDEKELVQENQELKENDMNKGETELQDESNGERATKRLAMGSPRPTFPALRQQGSTESSEPHAFFPPSPREIQDSQLWFEELIDISSGQ